RRPHLAWRHAHAGMACRADDPQHRRDQCDVGILSSASAEAAVTATRPVPRESLRPKKMPRVIGIDPGTVSIDLCGLDDGNVFLDRSWPTAEALTDPARFVAQLEAA